MLSVPLTFPLSCILNWLAFLTGFGSSFPFVLVSPRWTTRRLKMYKKDINDLAPRSTNVWMGCRCYPHNEICLSQVQNT